MLEGQTEETASTELFHTECSGIRSRLRSALSGVRSNRTSPLRLPQDCPSGQQPSLPSAWHAAASNPLSCLETAQRPLAGTRAHYRFTAVPCNPSQTLHNSSGMHSRHARHPPYAANAPKQCDLPGSCSARHAHTRCFSIVGDMFKDSRHDPSRQTQPSLLRQMPRCATRAAQAARVRTQGMCNPNPEGHQAPKPQRAGGTYGALMMLRSSAANGSASGSAAGGPPAAARRMCRPRRCCRRSWIARVVQRTRRRSGSCHTPRQPALTGCRYSRNSRSRSASPAGAQTPPGSQRTNPARLSARKPRQVLSSLTPPGSWRATAKASCSCHTDSAACCGALVA